MHLALLLARAGSEPDRSLVRGLTASARAAGHSVLLFILGDGVLEIDLAVEAAALGARVSLCEADAAARGLYKSGQPGVFFGSLYDWSRMVEDADRIISLA